MKKFTDTQKLVYAMLKENTGRHMLDSGGAYGRLTKMEKLTPNMCVQFQYSTT